MDTRIRLETGDITRLSVDAVVNAANASLLGGGGVDGAIHRAAGPGLLEETKRLGGCPPGEVRVTGGHRLPARWVIHAVGPVWRGGDHREAETLASCYRNALEAARELRAGSVAFPAISTGVYGYPLTAATAIAVREVRSFLARHDVPAQVVFVCFDDRTLEGYREALGR